MIFEVVSEVTEKARRIDRFWVLFDGVSDFVNHCHVLYMIIIGD